jgi:hypothetical protein
MDEFVVREYRTKLHYLLQKNDEDAYKNLMNIYKSVFTVFNNTNNKMPEEFKNYNNIIVTQAYQKFMYLLDVYLEAAEQQNKSLHEVLYNVLMPNIENSIDEISDEMLFEISKELKRNVEREFIYEKLMKKDTIMENISKLFIDSSTKYLDEIHTIFYFARENNNPDLIYRFLLLKFQHDPEFNPYETIG